MLLQLLHQPTTIIIHPSTIIQEPLGTAGHPSEGPLPTILMPVQDLLAEETNLNYYQLDPVGLI